MGEKKSKGMGGKQQSMSKANTAINSLPTCLCAFVTWDSFRSSPCHRWMGNGETNQAKQMNQEANKKRLLLICTPILLRV